MKSLVLPSKYNTHRNNFSWNLICNSLLFPLSLRTIRCMRRVDPRFFWCVFNRWFLSTAIVWIKTTNFDLFFLVKLQLIFFKSFPSETPVSILYTFRYTSFILLPHPPTPLLHWHPIRHFRIVIYRITIEILNIYIYISLICNLYDYMMLYICENKTPKPLKPMKIKNESKIL